MRKLHSFLLVSFAILSFAIMPNKQAKASHAAGGEIIYEWISDSTYRIFFKFYRDCSGIAEAGTETLCITDTCNSFQQSITMQKWTGALPGGGVNGTPVSAGCSAFPNRCQSSSSTLPGYQEWWYSTLVTLPNRCRFWRFSVGISARNGSGNIGGGNLYIETTFNNDQFQGNSSPYFSIKPIPYVCVNQPFTYNNGAIDPNGDSLSTDVINPMSASPCGPGTNIGLNTGFTPPLSIPGNPFHTNASFTTVPSTGQMSFTAAQTGPQTLTTRVREYRNGQLIGYIMRDIQVQVLNCTTVAPTFAFGTNIGGGGIGVGGRIEGCIGQTLTFDFSAKSNDTNAVLLSEDNHVFSIPAATVNHYGQKNDSIWGTFSWTPSASDGNRLFTLLVTVKDSTCLPPGIMLYYTDDIPIWIWGATRAVNDTSVCPKETAYLTATGGGNYLWSVLPGGSPIGSLSCTSCTSPIATPDLVTSYVVTSQLNSFCPNNKDTVVVGVLPGIEFTKLSDTLTCPNNPVKLDLKPKPGPGIVYSAKWTPATYLNNDTLLAPTCTPTAGGGTTYTVLITSNSNACKARDTVFVDVLTGFQIQNPDTNVCDGATVKARVIGDTRYTYSWSSDGLPGVFDNPNSMEPTITPQPLGLATYTLKASYPSCPLDSAGEFKITVEPNPIVTILDSAAMCQNDTLTLAAFVQPANFPFDLQWTPGASLDNAKKLNPVFKAQQSGFLVLTATSPLAKCTSADTAKMIVFPAQFVNPTGDTAVCPGTPVQLKMNGKAIKGFRWSPEIRISSTTAENPIVTPLTSQVYTVYAVDTNACYDTASVKVVIVPGAKLFMPDTVKLYPGESYQMDPSGNCSYFSWFPPIGLSRADISNPVVKPDVNTRYVVTGITESGCSTSDSVTVIVAAESVVELPNAFSPGSAPNATFKILRRGDATLKNFSIYNRWGMKVFETADIDKGWDGSYNGEPQPMGVYIYTIDAVSSNGRRFTKQGNVTLVR